MRRLLFLGDGPSDRGITVHIERIATECGVPVVVTAPDTSLLPGNDRSVPAKLDAIRRLGGEYDLLLIHRDADRASPQERKSEIQKAVDKVMPGSPWAPVIPVRMTEAWLVLDERQVREVAGNPKGRIRLPMPDVRTAERLADPKARLKELLVTASELTGRKRRMFQASFPYHRRLLLERLDPDGPVRWLRSWQDFDSDLRGALAALGGD